MRTAGSRRGPFVTSRFILGEGTEDAEFTRALIRTRQLSSCDVSPNIDIGKVGGNSGFRPSIIAVEPMTGFSSVSRVVLLADNDDNPKASFTAICEQIERSRRAKEVGRRWGTPKKPVDVAPGDPSLSIWMWPQPGQPGCLETLLWSVISAEQPSRATCVEEACQCAGADAWPVSKRDKARLRCFISIVCRANPALSLSNLWRDAPDLIPLTHSAFDEYANFLTKLSA